MANPIVTVNVSQVQAPVPSKLQKTGALLSQGGTTLSAGNYSLLAQFADLADLQPAALDLTSVVWASSYGGQVTATTAVAHGIPTNTEFVTAIADVVPAGYNGTVRAIATGASTFTYYLASDPGAQTTAGTYTRRNVAELESMARTFFNQGAQQSVYVLELGAGEPAAGVSELQDFIDASDQFFYSYLVPRSWDGVSEFLTFLANFQATTSKTYFFVTTNEQNMGLYDALDKCVVALIEAPVYDSWAANDLTAASWAGGVATLTTTTAHGVAPGDTFTIVGTDPEGYDGAFIALPLTTGSTLKYALAADPGAYVSDGTLVRSTYESAGPPAVEFTHASDYRVTLNYDPGTVNKVPPFAFCELFGVTPFPRPGNAALIATLNASSINYVGTGAEGGITNTILFNGHTMDGRPFNYWYAVDWMQINAELGAANAIINGSNDPTNPLYYNQDGINRLQQALASVGGQAISYGLALGRVVQTSLDDVAFLAKLNSGAYAGQLVVNAIPFIPYSVANPTHYRQGIYNGLTISFTPLRGFEQITINIRVTDFVSA